MNRIVPGMLVRAVSSIGGTAPRVVYAHVLSVSPLFAPFIGKDGQPSLSLVFFDEPNPLLLGNTDWHRQMDRKISIPHVSHPDVEARITNLAWVDVFPQPGSGISLPPIDPKDFLGERVIPTRTEEIILPSGEKVLAVSTDGGEPVPVVPVAPVAPVDPPAPYDGSGSERWTPTGAWTEYGQDSTGFPVRKGSAEDVTK